MSGFVWHDFGVLTRCVIDNGYVIITNDANKSLKMSMGRYKESALHVHDKALRLIHSPVTVRTSQNTSNWSTGEWFSEIEKR